MKLGISAHDDLATPPRSRWGILFIFLGCLLLVASWIPLIGLIFDPYPGLWLTFIIFLGAGLQMLFTSFIVNVLTDMRWYLKTLTLVKRDQ